MAQYAHAVKRCTIKGICFAGAEIWTTSFYIGSVGADVSNPTQQFADAIRTAWTAFFTNSTSKIASSYQTQEIKLAQVGTDGKTSLSNVIYAPYGTAINGGNAGGAFPAQIALAATLERTGSRGLAAKGRMYLPGVFANLQSNGTISTTDAGTIATNLTAFFDAVNAAAPTGERVILASQGRRVKDAQGEYQPVPGTAVNAVVDRVKVGSVLDTQRRRRNNLVEIYQTASLTP